MTDPRNAVNGSLWSLPLEFLMYLAVLALGMCRLLNKRWCLILVAGALLFEWLIVERIGFAPYSSMARYRVWIEQLPHLGFFFFGGTMMLLFKDFIVLDWRLFVGCIAVIAITWQGTFEWALTAIGHPELIRHAITRPPHGYFVFSVCLPYVVMYLAFVQVQFLKPVLQSCTRWGDFSYGVYLYGYPVEQMLFRTWGDKMSFPIFIALSCVGTLVLAVLSWHLVEKPFLKLKKRSTRPEGSGPRGMSLPVATPPEAERPISPPVAMQRQYSVMRQLTFFV
jgi:peptidoglycan/LPS O-acetylase OafA/YrhL